MPTPRFRRSEVAMRATPSGASGAPLANKPSMLLSFTGLIPVPLSIPVLLAHQYTLGLIANLALTSGVIGYHLHRQQGVSALDAGSLLFGLLTAIMHWGVHNDVILRHLDTAIYALLLAQVVLARLRGEAWTTQFAKRSVDSSLWATEAFRRGNAFVSAVWGGTLLLCLLCSVAPLTSAVVQLWVPLALLLGTGVVTPRLAHWYGGTGAGTRPLLS